MGKFERGCFTLRPAITLAISDPGYEPDLQGKISCPLPKQKTRKILMQSISVGLCLGAVVGCLIFLGHFLILPAFCLGIFYYLPRIVFAKVNVRVRDTYLDYPARVRPVRPINVPDTHKEGYEQRFTDVY